MLPRCTNNFCNKYTCIVQYFYTGCYFSITQLLNMTQTIVSNPSFFIPSKKN
jgi:hypothetical protein